MLYDLRTYTCRPGTIGKHMKLYEAHGWETQRRHLGTPLLYGRTETGDVNSYVHVWVYEDAADRERRRAALMADPAWLDYLEMSAEAGYLVSQVNTLLTPASFFPGK
jgi:hypothetical protein